jgi:hypothetical protein
MEKKVFYVVEIELQDVGDVKETTGHKTISLYTIKQEELESIGSVDCLLEDNSEDVVFDYLEDNGFGDENIKLKQL